jgi:hypothetical protein
MSNKQAETVAAVASIAALVFSKDVQLPVAGIAASLEKMRGDMGRFAKLAESKGLTKQVRSLSGDVVQIVTPEMGTKLRAAGLITTREAKDITAFHGAIKALELVLSYDARKAEEKRKLGK